MEAPAPVVNPSAEDQARQDGLIIASSVLVVMAGIFVVLRCVSRFFLIRTPGPDDYFMIGAMVLTIGYLINLFVLKANHLGFPMTMLSLDNMLVFMKVTLAIQVMYYAQIFCIKTSIVLTYLRFAVSGTFRKLCYATIALHAVFFVICLIVTLAQCVPLHKMWDFTGAVEGTCINGTAFFYTTSAFNIITDIWILVMPFKTLKSIQRPGHEKIALFIIFGVGAFATAASIIRLHTIYIYTLATDPFRDGVSVNLWSVIEVTIAISCASVSALKPIFSSRQRNVTRAAKSSAGHSQSGGGSRYMNTQNGNQRQHVRLASLDNSVKEVLQSRSSAQDRRSSMEKGDDSDAGNNNWAVPANLLQPPPQSRRAQPDNVELAYLEGGRKA